MESIIVEEKGTATLPRLPLSPFESALTFQPASELATIRPSVNRTRWIRSQRPDKHPCAVRQSAVGHAHGESLGIFLEGKMILELFVKLFLDHSLHNTYRALSQCSATGVRREGLDWICSREKRMPWPIHRTIGSCNARCGISRPTVGNRLCRPHNSARRDAGRGARSFEPVIASHVVAGHGGCAVEGGDPLPRAVSRRNDSR